MWLTWPHNNNKGGRKEGGEGRKEKRRGEGEREREKKKMQLDLLVIISILKTVRPDGRTQLLLQGYPGDETRGSFSTYIGAKDLEFQLQPTLESKVDSRHPFC
jgi:hypothetical protein